MDKERETMKNKQNMPFLGEKNKVFLLKQRKAPKKTKKPQKTQKKQIRRV